MKSCKERPCSSGKPAVWYPVLVLYAMHKGTMPARAKIDLAHCDDCREESKLEHFLTDEGWALLMPMFDGVGKMRPRRDLTELDWEYDDGEA